MKIKYQFKIKSVNKESLDLYQIFLKNIFQKLQINYSLYNLPTKKKRITLLKSPHVNKTAREQFEIKNYRAVIQLNTLLKPTILKFILLNKPKTVTINIKTK
jgi:ribosomal protein S10